MNSSAQKNISSSKAADDDIALPANSARPSPWKLEPSSSSSCVPILGATEVWPELSAAATTKGKASACSIARVLPDQPRTERASSMRRNPDAAQTSSHGGDRDSLDKPTTAPEQPPPILPSNNMSSTHRQQENGGFVINCYQLSNDYCDGDLDLHQRASAMRHNPNAAQDSPEKTTTAPEQSPPILPSNSMSSIHRQQKNGGFVPQHHSRGSQGYICSRGGRSMRPVGVSSGRGEVNGNGNRSRGGGQEPRGGFNNLHPQVVPHRRRHEDTHHGPGPSHRPWDPPMAYVEAPHPYYYPTDYSLMPPMFPCYYGPPVGYGYGPVQFPEFSHGSYFPPALPEAQLPPPFMSYAAPHHMHMMHMNLEQQAGLTHMNPLQYSTQEQQDRPRQELEQQHALDTSPEQLQQEIRAQIEYYFSNENLVRDMYLRKKMDEQGWVPLTLIAGFRKIISKTTDMEFILNSILRSTEVEVQDGKIRKRVGWEQYPLPRSN